MITQENILSFRNRLDALRGIFDFEGKKIALKEEENKTLQSNFGMTLQTLKSFSKKLNF